MQKAAEQSAAFFGDLFAISSAATASRLPV
jgi:hypothetical protein